MAYFNSGSRRLHYEALGEGTPIVLVHGFTNFGLSWMQQLPLLVHSGYRVIVPDLYGHGLSQRAAGVASVETLAADMVALLDHLSLDRAIVCGLSLGGMVAQQLALDYPQRVSALVIANSRAKFSDPHLKTVVEGWIATFEKPQGPELRLQATWPALLSERFRDSPTGEAALAIWTLLARGNSGASLSNVALGMLSFDVLERLGAIRVPTLVISGEHDKLFPPAQAKEVADGIPGATFHVIPGAAHISCLDSPAAFNRLLADFLAAVAPIPAPA
jgi:3-oxoadipate enol-lactonase